MLIESSSIPLPSEVIMGFAGYLVYKREMTLLGVALVGALGNISGSTIMYIIGIKGGRPLVEKYGKLFHISKEKLEKSDKWFAKWGDELVFIAQLLPGVRTFVSLPAGIVKVNFPKFIIYTFSGAFIWCYALAFTASKFGENWKQLVEYIKDYQLVVGVALILISVFLGYKLLKRR